MIKSFQSKALRSYWEEQNSRYLSVTNHARVRRILLALDAAGRPEDMNLPGYRFHTLNSNPQRWSVWVTGNYRITFAWQGADAMDVDLLDYH